MWTVATIEECREHRAALTGTVALVPTMGALHAGHLSLVEAGKQLADHVLATLYVNPTQFAPNEDFDQYPRPRDEDLAKLERAGVAGVFTPTDAVIYPPQQLPVDIRVPAIAATLEGESRPTHFDGVCRVVTKLFNITQPDVACFGRKDYQQLKIIEAMATDMAMPLRIVGCPTVREQDGLAMSSRNAYLHDEDRQHARGLYKALSEARHLVEQQGETDPATVEAAMQNTMQAHRVEVDYAVVRHPHTLAELDCIEPQLTGGVVALVAGRVGDVRLIDNMVLAEQV